MKQNVIITTHNLDFEAKPFYIQIPGEPTNICFKVGTCHGLYIITKTAVEIIAITNEQKGNGHLNDVFEWFEYSCKTSKRNLRIVELMNKQFEKHLITKRGFQKQGDVNVIKYFI